MIMWIMSLLVMKVDNWYLHMEEMLVGMAIFQKTKFRFLTV